MANVTLTPKQIIDMTNLKRDIREAERRFNEWMEAQGLDLTAAYRMDLDTGEMIPQTPPAPVSALPPPNRAARRKRP